MIDDYSPPNNGRLVARHMASDHISPGEISACFDNGALRGYCEILRFMRQRQSSRARWKIVSNVFATGRPKTRTGIKKKDDNDDFRPSACHDRTIIFVRPVENGYANAFRSTVRFAAEKFSSQMFCP